MMSQQWKRSLRWMQQLAIPVAVLLLLSAALRMASMN
jgi:hypothetical protein